MRICQFVTLLLCVAFARVAAQEVQAPLDAAKALYIAAAYQEALSALDNVTGGEQLDEAVKYRALCLLGLNRPQDAEQAIERLIERRPLFTLDELDSPKLRAMFRDARSRVLPGAATKLYQQARASLDRGELVAAADQFGTVIKLLDEPEVASQPSAADLKVLATGFAKLVTEQLSLERQRSTPPSPTPSAAPPAERAPDAAALDHVFGDADADVVPPVPLSQTMPAWVPPSMAVRSITFAGTLELVIDEHGAVTSVEVTRPTIATYDRLLVTAARTWQYRPAFRGGEPVKYRKTVHITLRPQTSAVGGTPQIK
jgi:TonB family protein